MFQQEGCDPEAMKCIDYEKRHLRLVYGASFSAPDVSAFAHYPVPSVLLQDSNQSDDVQEIDLSDLFQVRISKLFLRGEKTEVDRIGAESAKGLNDKPLVARPDCADRHRPLILETLHDRIPGDVISIHGQGLLRAHEGLASWSTAGIYSLRLLLYLVDLPLHLADQLCYRDFLGADFRAFPQGLTPPGALLPVEDGDPLRETLVPRVEEIAKGPNKSGRPHVICGFRVLVYRTR